MTVIADAKELLKSCQRTEDSIYDLVSFCTCHEDVDTIHYQIERVPKMTEECQEMVHSLLANEPSSKTYELRNNLRRMSLRLEAAIMYAKNYFKLN
jgi:Ni2+-binding GTPase involved in maturation of urease and hydrogenase